LNIKKESCQKVSSSDKTGEVIFVFFLDLRFVFLTTSNTSFINFVLFFVRFFLFGTFLSGIGVSSFSDEMNSLSFSFASRVFCLSKSIADFNRVFLLN
jgi:hypothetical protein